MRQQLDLNFIEKSNFSLSNLSLLSLALLTVSLVFAVFTWQSLQTKHEKYSAIEEKLHIDESKIKQNSKSDLTARADIPNEKKQQILSIVTTLTIPWTELLQSIEASDLQDVALISFEPNVNKQRVVLTGEAKNLETVLAYIQKLEAQPMLDSVYLQKHNIDDVNPSKPVRFTVLAQWRSSLNLPVTGRLAINSDEKAQINGKN